MRQRGEEKSCQAEPSLLTLENGIHSAKCIAASSREYTVVNMTVRLKPGEYIDINCLHGVEGTYSVC